MIKKRLANGEPCNKCVQAEELLKNRGFWDRIDDVVWAIEGEPESAGMKLATQYGLENAPFFVVRDGDDERVYESVIRLMKEALSATPTARRPAGAEQPFGPERVAALAAEWAEREPTQILGYALEHFGASAVIAFSGAEDVVLIDMAVKTKLPFSVLTLDTGRLHPETYELIDKVRSRYGVEISVLFPDRVRVEELVRKKGLFSFYEDGHEECCGIRKVEPLRRALAGYRAWITGQRRDQSPATRSSVEVVELDARNAGVDGALVKFNPLARFSSAQVFAYIKEHGVPYNALHDRGFRSIGCAPCTRAVAPHEHERAGRWWWEEATKRECGLHVDSPAAPDSSDRPAG